MEVNINPPSFRRLDGRWEHHIRQSDINRFRMCPEQHRAHIFGESKQRTTDVALIGTCFHLGAQWAIDNDCGFADSNEVAQNLLAKEWDNVFRTEIVELSTAQNHVYACLETFWNELLVQILEESVIGTETQFDVLVHEDRTRAIYLSGTRDVDTEKRIWDFKTSTATDKWQEWKVSRYQIQHVVYAWARDQAGITKDQGRKFTTQYGHDDELDSFRYAIIDRESHKLSTVNIQPTVRDAVFLLKEIEHMCRAMEYLPKDNWPIKPDEWHCSPKWCDNWDNCRGKLYGPDPWGLIAKTPHGKESLEDKLRKSIELTQKEKVKQTDHTFQTGYATAIEPVQLETETING